MDRVAAGQMEAAYGRLLGQAHTDLAAFNKKLVIWQQANPSMDPRGASPSRHWVYQQERYTQLVSQLEANLAFYAKTSTKSIAGAQEAAMRQSQADNRKLMAASMGGGAEAQGKIGFAVLPEQAIAAVVGFTSDGTPLNKLLAQRSRDAGVAATNALVDGVAFGRGPRAVADAMDASLNQMHWQNLRLARTEMMRSYREAQRVDMLQNAAVLSGWRWSAAGDKRSCPACFAMQGQVFPIHNVDPDNVSPDTAQHKGLADVYAKAPSDTALVR